ncbi:MAG: dihydroorotase [Candidatus Rokuibacteriota bacterium]
MAEALWGALLDGTVDIVATDHAPHLPAEKEAGRHDIWKAPGGFPRLQTWLPLMLDQVAKGRWTLVDLIRCCAEAPARLFGLYPRKGALEPGSDADLVIVDPTRTMTIDNDSQVSRARVTPFAGRVVTGVPVLTMVRGQVVMRDGAVTGRPRGALVTPVRTSKGGAA